MHERLVLVIDQPKLPRLMSDLFEIGFREVLYHYGDRWSMGVLKYIIEKQMLL